MMEIEIKEAEQEIANAIAKLYNPVPRREPGWVDIGQMCLAWGCDAKKALYRLNRMVAHGMLEKRLVYDLERNRIVAVWRLMSD